MLIDLLEQHNPSARSPSTSTLDTIFSEIEKVRIPRTAMLVKKAREMGEYRVLAGTDACLARNSILKALCREKDAHIKRFGV